MPDLTSPWPSLAEWCALHGKKSTAGYNAMKRLDPGDWKAVNPNRKHKGYRVKPGTPWPVPNPTGRPTGTIMVARCHACGQAIPKKLSKTA